jgi:hypothetical protein
MAGHVYLWTKALNIAIEYLVSRAFAEGKYALNLSPEIFSSHRGIVHVLA